jgi:hypothetical protein
MEVTLQPMQVDLLLTYSSADTVLHCLDCRLHCTALHCTALHRALPSSSAAEGPLGNMGCW